MNDSLDPLQKKLGVYLLPTIEFYKTAQYLELSD